MGIFSTPRGWGRLTGLPMGDRETKQKSRPRPWTVSGALICVALFANPAAADPLRDGTRAFAAHDYVRAAQIFTDLAPQGNPMAQTYLGYMYANGQGVPQDYVKAYALVNLAVAKAGPEREAWVRIRDAIASKLSLAERTIAQQMSFEGVPEVGCLPIVTGVQVAPFPFLFPNIIP